MVMSSQVGSLICDRCGRRVMFDILVPPVTWRTHKIMDVDVILCPDCAKKYNEMILKFMKNEDDKI